MQVYDCETYKTFPYNTLGEKEKTSWFRPEERFLWVGGSFASTIWLCAHTFKPLKHNFSENSFENDKILHNNEPQQLFLKILRDCQKS